MHMVPYDLLAVVVQGLECHNRKVRSFQPFPSPQTIRHLSFHDNSCALSSLCFSSKSSGSSGLSKRLTIRHRMKCPCASLGSLRRMMRVMYACFQETRERLCPRLIDIVFFVLHSKARIGYIPFSLGENAQLQLDGLKREITINFETAK